jgi:hypothetical protein
MLRRIIERLMLPNERSTMQWTHDRNDITEEVCRWYLLRSVRIFGRASRLSKAQDLETITVYLPENGQLELELMLFFLISFRTFHKLRKISYCFSATRVSKEGLELTMTKMHAMWQMGRDLEFNMIPWSEVRFGCQHDISGFHWETEDGRAVEVGVAIYHG